MIQRSSMILHNHSYEMQREGDVDYVQLKDPFTGEHMVPGHFPTSLEQANRIEEGLDYLDSRAGAVALTLVGVRHASGVAYGASKLRSLFNRHDAIFLEGHGHTARSRADAMAIAAGNKLGATPEDREVYDAFMLRTFDSLCGVMRPTYYADIPADGNEYESVIADWSPIAFDFEEQAKAATNLSDYRISSFMQAVGLATSSVFREGYMLGKIGADLKDLQMRTGYAATRPMFMVGTLHTETMPSRIEKIGIDYEIETPQPLVDDRSYGLPRPAPFSWTRAAREGRAPVDNMQATEKSYRQGSSSHQ